MDHLWALARDASDVPGTPSEEACAEILSRWSWPAMFDELARAVEGEVDEDAGRMLALMEKLSLTSVGTDALATATAADGRLAVGFDSSDARVRGTACALARGVFERASSDALAGTTAEATRARLRERLAMDDTSVASAASEALVAMCARFPNEVPRELREVLATTSREGATSEFKVRGVAFAASVAGANADAAAAVVRSGALDECVREIDGADLLASLASLEILAEVAETSEAAANGLKSIDALSATLVRVVLDENADVALRTRALVVGGRIAATVSSGDDAFVVEMTRVIDEASRSECGRELSDAAIDALGAVSVARSRVASAVVLRAKSVVADAAHKSFRGTGESQIVALHALANVFGAERSRDATLDDDAERVLADVCFAACGSKPFAKVIHDAIAAKSDHFLNLRVAVYRFLSAAGARRPFAEEIAADPQLRRTLCGDLERTAVASQFRASALRSLADAGIADTVAADQFAAAAVGASASAAPTAVPDVATAHH